MSFIDGMAALNLEMPDRVPRTEYSVEMHLDLINRVLGLNLSPDAPIELWTKARRDFMQAWNYGFVWSTVLIKTMPTDAPKRTLSIRWAPTSRRCRR